MQFNLGRPEVIKNFLKLLMPDEAIIKEMVIDGNNLKIFFELGDKILKLEMNIEEVT